MTLTIRFWDFDMDSNVLGPIRCAHFDATKKFNEFEDSIRAGTVDSTALARDIFRTVACRRTGDAAIDAKCGGSKFTEEEVSTLPADELDQFCDKLMKGSLRLVATPAETELPEAPAFPTGREGLAAALLHAAEKSRAAMKRTLDAAERSFRAISVFDAQHAALGGNAFERAMRGIRRDEELLRGAVGSKDIFKSALGQTSRSAATEAMLGIGGNRDMIKAALGINDRAKSFLDETSMNATAQTLAGIGRSEDLFKGVMGIDDHTKSLLGPMSMSTAVQAAADLQAAHKIAGGALGTGDHINTVLGGQASANAALKAMSGIQDFEETARRFTNTTRPIVQNLNDMGNSEVLPSLQVPLPESVPYRMPLIHNPIHKTNEIVGELLAHQKAEAGKKDTERSEAATESVDNKKIAKSSLIYTKAAFWLAFIAFLFATAWGIWVYLEAKADALETEKKTEVQLEKLRAEIRALKVSKPAAEPPSKTPVSITPAAQAGGKPR